MDRLEGTRDPGFLADLRASFGVLMAHPTLPLLSLGVWGLPALLPPGWSALALPISIFSIGYRARSASGS